MDTLKILVLSMLALGGLVTNSAATEPSIEQALEQLGVDANRSELPTAPIPGFLEIRRGVQILYISTDGKLLINGDILSLTTERNLTERSRAEARADLIAALPPELRIIVPATTPVRGRIVVFVDTNCPYCRALHERRAEFTQRGLEVHFLFFPRSGPSGKSFGQAVSVWCATDKLSALDSALSGAVLPPADCEHPIEQHYELARALHLKGTPALITPNGELRYGAVDVDDLLH